MRRRDRPPDRARPARCCIPASRPDVPPPPPSCPRERYVARGPQAPGRRRRRRRRRPGSGARGSALGGSRLCPHRRRSRRCRAAPGWPCASRLPAGARGHIGGAAAAAGGAMLVAVYPAPLGPDVPAPRPLPHQHPPLPAGGRFKPEKAGRRCLGLAGGVTRCRQKNRRRGEAGLGGVAPPPPTARAHGTRYAAAHEFPGPCASLPSPALDGCHGNGARAPPPDRLVCSSCSCCLCRRWRRPPGRALRPRAVPRGPAPRALRAGLGTMCTHMSMPTVSENLRYLHGRHGC